MSKKMFMISILLLSSSLKAAVDYSHCQNQLNLMKAPVKGDPFQGFQLSVQTADFGDDDDEGDDEKSVAKAKAKEKRVPKIEEKYFPFELTAEGKVIPHPSVNLKKEGNKDVMTFKKDNGEFEYVVLKNDKGEIISYETSFDFSSMKAPSGFGMFNPYKSPKKAEFKRSSTITTKFDYRNGKCYPSRIDSLNRFGDESRQDVMFDAKLCRDINQFFKKNPEAKSCFEPKMMAKASALFDDFYKNNSDIYGDLAESLPGSAPKSINTKMKSDQLGASGLGGIYPGVGIGMGGFMPMTTEQALTPIGFSVDTLISSSRNYAAGLYNSPVISAAQIQMMCDNQLGFGNPPAISNDEDLWALPSAQATSGDAGTIKK